MSSSTLSSPAGLKEFGERYVTNGLGRSLDGVMVKGEGSYVELADGRRMLDFTCGIGVTGFGKDARIHDPPPCRQIADLTSFDLEGHCHPKISKAAADQCINLVHGQVSPTRSRCAPRR